MFLANVRIHNPFLVHEAHQEKLKNKRLDCSKKGHDRDIIRIFPHLSPALSLAHPTSIFPFSLISQITTTINERY